MKSRLLVSIYLVCLSVLFCRQNYAADISIDFFDTNSLALEPQEDPVACWAASMSAALKSKGIDLPQASIKTALNGDPRASTLKDPRELSQLLNRLPYREGKLKAVTFTPPALWISWPNFKKEITAGNPFVVGYWLAPQQAHLVVIYGVITDDNDRPILYKIWDPEPGIGLRTASVISFDSKAWFYLILRSATLDTPTADNDNLSDNGDEFKNKLFSFIDSVANEFSSVRGSLTLNDERSKIYDSNILLPGSSKTTILIYKIGQDKVTDARAVFNFKFTAGAYDLNSAEKQYSDLILKTSAALGDNWAGNDENPTGQDVKSFVFRIKNHKPLTNPPSITVSFDSHCVRITIESFY